MEPWLIFLIALILLVLIPIAPKLVRLRIRILRWIHWNWAANLIENHFDGFVIFVRIILFVVAGVLIYVAMTQ